MPQRLTLDLPTPEQIWRRYDDDEQRLSAPLSERMLDLAQLRPGMRVLDLATGRGEPAIRAAHRVGTAGAVVGVDRDPAMLLMTRERAAREGVSNLELHALNAELLDQLRLKPCAVTLARWGFMYFDAPIAALAAARRATIPGGILVAAVWAEPERVPYYTLPRELLAKHLELPALDPEAPGTFRYANPERLTGDLAAAGYRISHTEELEVPVMEAYSATQLIAWTRAFGINRLLSGVSDAIQSNWEADMQGAYDRLQEANCVRLGGITRIVVAQAIP